MNQSNVRKPIFQNYYNQQDYVDTLKKLPEVIKNVERKSLEIIEPTIFEQRNIMDSIREFLRIKGRKIYGGTAINELVKQVNPDDAIYDNYSFGDIDFYSPQPRADIVDLCNFLFDKNKYKNISANEAQHDETYRIYVNWQLYCNITYVPMRIYSGIKVIMIDNLQYVDPHFLWIDQLRIFNNPMLTSRLWEKTFKREYVLLKNYPLESFEINMQISKIPMEITGYHYKIKQEFLIIEKIRENTLITGFDAYNFYVKYASNKIISECPVPFLELVSTDYVNTVIKLYAYIKSIVTMPRSVSIVEYSPFFQFAEHSVMISYNEHTLVLIREVNDICVPIINVSSGVKYATYQYLLMSLLINKFRSFLDKDKIMYKNYGAASSNLIKIKNDYLWENKLPVINNSPFSIFKTTCIGTPISPTRLYLTRRNERRENGKRQEFTYEPEKFFKTPIDTQQKFDPKKFIYKNTSGNVIIKSNNLRFVIDGDNIIEKNNIDESPINDDSESVAPY